MQKKFFQFCFIFLFFFPLLEGKHKNTLSIMAVFRDEAEYLKEWIEFHRIVGVEYFLLYNHLSQDNYLEVLAPYIQEGIVELHDVSGSFLTIQNWNHLQCSLYLKGLLGLVGKTEWVAVLDIDEFLFPVKENDLRKYLSKFKKAGAVGVNWQLYGTSNVERVLPHELLIEKLTWKAEATFGENCHIKSIVKPKYVIGCKDPHCFLLKKGIATVASNKKVIVGPRTPEVDISEIRINHYWTRDEKYFRERKIARRQGWQEGIDGVLRRKEALHKVEDNSIHRFIPLLKKRLLLPAG